MVPAHVVWHAVLDTWGSYRKVVLIGVGGVLSRHMYMTYCNRCNCFLALISDINFEVINNFYGPGGETMCYK